MTNSIFSHGRNDVALAISKRFSEDLNELNLDEILNLLWDLVASVGDSEAPFSYQVTAMARKFPLLLEESPAEVMGCLWGIVDCFGDSEKNIYDYVRNWWTEQASEFWGVGLSQLNNNDIAWLAFCLCQKIVDADNFCHEELEELGELIGEWAEEGEIQEMDLTSTAKAVVVLAIERFYEGAGQNQYDDAPEIPLGEFDELDPRISQ